MSTELTPERLKYLREQADLATCCLTMVSIHVEIGGQKVVAYAMPWEWLETCRNFYLAGATNIAAFAGRYDAGDAWYWHKPVRKGKRAAPSVTL